MSDWDLRALMEEYDHLRSFGRTHLRVCADLGYSHETMNHYLARAGRPTESKIE